MTRPGVTAGPRAQPEPGRRVTGPSSCPLRPGQARWLPPVGAASRPALRQRLSNWELRSARPAVQKHSLSWRAWPEYELDEQSKRRERQRCVLHTENLFAPRDPRHRHVEYYISKSPCYSVHAPLSLSLVISQSFRAADLMQEPSKKSHLPAPKCYADCKMFNPKASRFSLLTEGQMVTNQTRS